MKKKLLAGEIAKLISSFIRKNEHALVLAQEIQKLRTSPTMLKMVTQLGEFLVEDTKSKQLVKEFLRLDNNVTLQVESLIFKLVSNISLNKENNDPILNVVAEFLSADDCELFNFVDGLSPKDFKEEN